MGKSRDKVVGSDKIKEARNNRDNVSSLFKLDCKKFSEIDDLPQTWLWHNHIPYETCTLIVGTPGIGKSQFLNWLGAQVSCGNNFLLNGTNQKFDEGSVIILASEDRPSQGIKPRLKALNANLDKIFFLKSAIDNGMGKKKRMVALDSDLQMLRDKLTEIGDVKLIIVDPVTGFLGKVRDNYSDEVRNFLDELNDLAEEFKIAILLNKHQRKKGNGQAITTAMDEISGSAAWPAVIRQAFLIAEYNDDPSKILLVNLKRNLLKKSKLAISYSINSHSYLNKNGDNIDTSFITWNDGYIEINADEALNTDSHNLSKKDAAVKFITDYLKKYGQSHVFKIWNEAQKSNIAKATFYRAKDDIAIEETTGIGGKKMWNLIDD